MLDDHCLRRSGLLGEFATLHHMQFVACPGLRACRPVLRSHFVTNPFCGLSTRKQRLISMRLAAEDRALGTLETLVFDNQFTKDLPADPKKLNRLREVHGAFYSWVEPTPSAGEPHTVIASPQVARLIGLDPMELDRPEFAKIFSGNEPLPGVEPYAQCYGGHQFGVWAGQVC